MHLHGSNAATLQIFEHSIVPLWLPRRVIFISPRNKNDDALPSSGQQHPVSIQNKTLSSKFATDAVRDYAFALLDAVDYDFGPAC